MSCLRLPALEVDKDLKLVLRTDQWPSLKLEVEAQHQCELRSSTQCSSRQETPNPQTKGRESDNPKDTHRQQLCGARAGSCCCRDDSCSLHFLTKRAQKFTWTVNDGNGTYDQEM